ncbi:hypothetical protein [Nocardia donostiensis]|uniref:Uncharacterized protein n=1 Tax=Nocardia donostiensis TaxID=1538463 RepID=A0A1W0AR01_9NOCA|nr:hypothetical protein [Nocardia donostiensis]ONM49820.1 hypothetical protein B0T46_05305 [Nocardia donostiensis]OQS12683.1 hypothetical protein B0T36_23630 [Nocardia donostiensis]OQS22227.1 hypothetical protein B0T44_06230 [Nocardia donostiensis]
MATIDVRDQAIAVHMPGWEGVAARRSVLVVPRAALSDVSVAETWVSEPFGLRHGGLVVSGLIKVGVWLELDGTRRLLSMRRGVPTLRLLCDPGSAEGFSEILVSVRDAHAVAARLAEEVRG